MTSHSNDVNAGVLASKYLAHLRNKNSEAKSSRSGKSSFWATDSLRPMNEIYWRWKGVPETNPIDDEKLSMFTVANLYEDDTIKSLSEMGICCLPTEDNKFGLPLKRNQYYMSMERLGVPITGNMDGMTHDGLPVEIKTHGFDAVDSMFDRGEPPNDNYLHQLAIYMDFLSVDKGFIVQRNRSNGRIFFFDVHRTDEYCFECNGYKFNLLDMYEKWADLYHNYIVKDIEPPLEYEYRPHITKELLDNYAPDKIVLAIKGKRVLSDHNWRPQYCNWKDLWIQREMEIKGVDNVNDLLTYSEEEVLTMMMHIGKYAKVDKNGKMRLYLAKDGADITSSLSIVMANREEPEE